jgi:hypothetical protein
VPEHGRRHQRSNRLKWRLVRRIDDNPCCPTHLVLPHYTSSYSKLYPLSILSSQVSSTKSNKQATNIIIVDLGVTVTKGSLPTRFVSQFPLSGRRPPGWLNMICWAVTNLLRTAAIEYAHHLYDITQKEETRSLVKVIFESLFPYINTSTLLITPSSRHHRHSLL